MHETPNGHGVKSIDFNSPQSIIWHYGFFALPTYNEIDWQYYQPTKKSFWMQTRWSNDGIINTITIWISRHLTHSPEVFHDSFPTLTLHRPNSSYSWCFIDGEENRLCVTVFENQRKSLIQHSERSELRLQYEWTKVN